MKLCGMCKKEKPFSAFYKNRSKGGYQSYCIECAKKRRAQWARDNTPKTKEYRLKYKYGLSDDIVFALLRQQNNKCGVCSREFTETLVYNIDHDHSCCPGTKTCGECIRGLVCTRCNIGLGFIEDQALLTGAIAYLTSK